jgi:hypothetical protein
MNKLDKLVKLILSELEGGKASIEYKPANESNSYAKAVGYYDYHDQLVLYIQRSFAPKGLRENSISIYNYIPHLETILTSLPKEEIEVFIEKLTMATFSLFSEIIDLNKVTILNVVNFGAFFKVFFEHG